MIGSHLPGQRVRSASEGQPGAQASHPGSNHGHQGGARPRACRGGLTVSTPSATATLSCTPACPHTSLWRGVPRPSLRGVPGSVNRWAVLASSLPAPFDSASCLPAQASPLPIPPCSMRDLCWLNSVSSETELWWGRDAVIYSPVFPEPGTASGTHRRVPRVAPGAGL